MTNQNKNKENMQYVWVEKLDTEVIKYTEAIQLFRINAIYAAIDEWHFNCISVCVCVCELYF